jgi:phycocyanobilin:ferredoxin oxidoreductase
MPVVSPRGRERRVAEIRAAHTRFCDKQLENDKTRRVLEAAFGKEVARRYMREVLFDLMTDGALTEA